MGKINFKNMIHVYLLNQYFKESTDFHIVNIHFHNCNKECMFFEFVILGIGFAIGNTKK